MKNESVKTYPEWIDQLEVADGCQVIVKIDGKVVKTVGTWKPRNKDNG